LLGIRETVQAAAEESAALRAAVAEIGSFVSAVNGIADQTNLLGLNASIEAARAGEHGAGFAVVAEEVRKLAGQARVSAEEVARITRSVTQRVEATSVAMAAGVDRVDLVERAAHEIGDALSSILDAAERTRRAAGGVAAAAEENARAAVEAAGDVAHVAETAARHADTAAGVRHATAEQEGAAALAAAATARLTSSAESLRALVGGLRVAHATAPADSEVTPEPQDTPPSEGVIALRPRLRVHRKGAAV
ncbi:MAG TPA: methyl-accepting chemotaxis protein, partial [Longimicrobiaceae bacterium]|nr:methyl-accepting chemotaxis protein [Longimicrobiaceae bacterium]